jgi:hypothetical protein
VKVFAVLIVVAVALVGCTDASRSALGTLGSEADIVCYSGGRAVFSDRSTGKILGSESGAGVYYRSKNSGRYVRAYADCIVTSE